MPGIIKLSSPATSEFWEIGILHEDEWLLVVNKPAGLLTSPDRYDPNRPNLMKLLHRDIERQASWARERNLSYLMNAHRLDFETSGIIVLAKSKEVLVKLVNLFGTEKPVKTYIAFVHGAPMQDQFTVDVRLAPDPRRLGLMRPDPKKGKKSKTDFEVTTRFRGYAQLLCRPRTGRTHQIRVHLKSVNLPIVGDTQYGGGPLLLSRIKRAYKPKKDGVEKPLIGRVALHAIELRLPHPMTGNDLTVTAPWPKDLQVALRYLKQFAGL